MQADNFILATGSFFSHGLEATPDSIYEPVFGLDVQAPHDRTQWYDMDMYKNQKYMRFGVVTDENFAVSKDGNVIKNLHAVGSIIGGHDAMKEESGAGVAILTAIKVADDIINGK